MVDFPAPLEPNNPRIPFSLILKLMSLIAHVLVYRCERLAILTIFFSKLFRLVLLKISGNTDQLSVRQEPSAMVVD